MQLSCHRHREMAMNDDNVFVELFKGSIPRIKYEFMAGM